MSYPVKPEEFTPEWVEEAFKAPAGSLASLSHEPVGTGQVCDSYRFRCDWTNGEGPATFIAKCPSADPISQGAAKLFHLYENETGWYRDVAPHAGVSCPTPYYAKIDPEDDARYVLLLEDMAPAVQGDQIAGGNVGQMRATLNEAAALHSWRPDGDDWPSLGWTGNAEGNGAYTRATIPQNYATFRERFTELLSADVLDLGEELTSRFDAYLDGEPRTETCLAHGDMRLDNILFDPRDGRAILVDWQTVGLGIAGGDVAYLIGTSFADPAERRAVEGELVDFYCERRAALGQPVDREALWHDYRHAAFAGFIMAINAALHVEQTERGDRMFAAMAERPAQMAIDLESLSLV